MREIKFRGKCLETGEWIYGYYAKTTTTDEPFCFGDCRIHNLIIKDGLMFYVDGSTIGQHTWLKDKSGKEIYEGDIVKYFKDELGVVKFLKNCFCIESDSNIEFMCDLAGGIEVVGNIYEDPKMISI